MTQDTTTREICARCNDVSVVGFSVAPDVWEAVAGERWQYDVLCLRCFARLGDEKYIQWDVGIELFPVSFVTHNEDRRARA